MTPQQTHEIVEHIDDGVKAIRDRININTWIFSVVAIGTIIIGVVVILLVQQGRKQARQSEINYALGKSALEMSAKANAKLEASDALYMTYIKTTVGQILDKLQKDNPQIKVPRNPVPRPPGLPPPTDSELDRPQNERLRALPTPETARARTRVIVKYKRPRSTPTPKPFFPFWKNKTR